jgi:hypothetical protein
VRPGEAVEIEMVRDLFACSPGGSDVREVGSALAFRVSAAPDARELNRVLGLERLEQLDELESLFDGARFWVSLDPAVELDDALLERGFEDDYAWQKFEREPELVSIESDLPIGEANERFGEVFAAAYGMPAAFAEWVGRLPGRAGWHCLAAFDHGEPVATGALFASASTGWLGFGATLPSHRGRRAHGALLAARIALGAELGLDLLVTETGVLRDGVPGPSYRNILRAGFREAYVRPNYVRG